MKSRRVSNRAGSLLAVVFGLATLCAAVPALAQQQPPNGPPGAPPPPQKFLAQPQGRGVFHPPPPSSAALGMQGQSGQGQPGSGGMAGQQGGATAADPTATFRGSVNKSVDAHSN